MYKNIGVILAYLIPFLAMAQTGQINSVLEIYDIEKGSRKLVHSENAHFEAPNWSTDGSYLIINQKGLLYKIPVDGGRKVLLDSEPLDQCNNDHGISPDGNFLAISNNDPVASTAGGTSRIYVMPLEGGQPKRVTPLWPSYWHGWSPDSKTLVYTAMRNGDFDIYSIPVGGGEEVRLTSAKGLDDGPEYSADGKYIYYNSMESGSMELWRMKADGRDKVQLTLDEVSNWFPHPSPDGKLLVYLAYLEDQGDSHPPMKDVALRLFNLNTREIKTLCEFTGGQGTINVPSWSPDSKKFAFVSYNTLE